jgi:hypothetical protein
LGKIFIIDAEIKFDKNLGFETGMLNTYYLSDVNKQKKEFLMGYNFDRLGNVNRTMSVNRFAPYYFIDFTKAALNYFETNEIYFQLLKRRPNVS